MVAGLSLISKLASDGESMQTQLLDGGGTPIQNRRKYNVCFPLTPSLSSPSRWPFPSEGPQRDDGAGGTGFSFNGPERFMPPRELRR